MKTSVKYCVLRSSRLPIMLRAALLAALTPITSMFAAADETQLQVPVRIMSAPTTQPQMDPTMVPREAPPEVTPAAKMPQYQLHLKDHGDPGDSNSSHLRFILAVPGQPLLIDASISIDGQPFRQAREKRVQEILRYITDPGAFNAEAARVAAEAQAAAAAANSPGLLQSITDFVTGNPSTEEATSPAAEETPESKDSPPASEGTPEEVNADEATPEASSVPAADTPTGTEPLVPADPVVPAAPKYAAPANIYERIDRYSKSTGTSPSVDEIRWLLTNWIDGPVLLFLNDNFQRFRAQQQPVFQVLDRDRDGRVSADELKQAVASFQECDLDRNDVVEATELSQVAADPRNDAKEAAGGALIFRIPNEATPRTAWRRLAARYADPSGASPKLARFDADGDGSLSAEELRQLQEGPADIQLRIEWDTKQPDVSRLTIEGFGHEFAGLKDGAKAQSASVILRLPAFDLEFLAAQGASSDQVSVGAVDDGYAMLPELDPNGDGRFSVRELRELNDRLSEFDLDQNGEITSEETHPTFRVCIGLGATAHQPLALLRAVNAPTASQAGGPEWFQEMDKNKDDDLTRKEFPGTDEQFKELDRDADELISAAEATKSEK